MDASPKFQTPAVTPVAEAEDGLSPLAKALVGVGIGLALILALTFGLILHWSTPVQTSNPSAALGSDGETLVIPPDRPRQLADFSLTDQRGRTIHRDDLRGKILAVSFLFTSCTVVCPYVSVQMEKIQEATANQPNVQLLSITYDPLDDTQDVLADFSHRYNADPARWLFLTGDEDAVRGLIRTSFLDPQTGEFAFPGSFEHTQRIALVDTQGKIVSYFDGLNDNSGAAAIARIRQMESAP